MRPSSTQRSFYSLIILGKSLLLLPVQGAKGTDSVTLKFSWSSSACIRSLIFSFFVLLDFLFFARFVWVVDKKFPQSAGLFYFAAVFIYSISLIDIARKWPQLMTYWEQVDRDMEHYPITSNYHRKMKIIAATIMFLAIFEHAYFMYSKERLDNATIWERAKFYFTSIFGSVFMVLPYNIVLGLFLQILNWLCTLTWNYADVFLTTICIPLNFRFEQIEQQIEIMIEERIGSAYRWKEIREHFVNLCKLTEKVENCISVMLVVSIGNKLYATMYQLVSVITNQQKLSTNQSPVEMGDRLYFWFSVIIILLRILGVSWSTGQVFTTSQNIADRLFSVPSENYNVEVDRLLFSIQYFPPCITGLKLFEMKNSFTVKIASSIIVYELVLVEYREH